MAIEKLKMAARAAQPKVISMMRQMASTDSMLPRWSVTHARAAMVVTSPSAVQQRQRLRQPYPNYRVIVLDDDVNTFQHVVECLVRHIPAMNPDKAWELAHRIDGEGSAVVWSGPMEQAEHYHQLLSAEGLTMAPLEKG
jgi:ATP-dependent Clp protease adaptor protein ClpS